MPESISVRAGGLLSAVAVLIVGFAFFHVQAFALGPVDQIDLPTGLDELRVSVRGVDGKYAYFATSSEPAEIVKFDQDSFEFVGSITLEPSESFINSGFVEPEGRYAFFGTGTSPGRVVRVDLETFERVDALELEEGMNSLRTGFVDHDGQYGYFGTNTSPGQLVRINLEDFELAGSIEMDMDNQEVKLAQSVIDPAGEFAYLMSNQGVQIGLVPPARVIKIDLDAFERVDAITLASGEYWLSSAHMDPAGEYLWGVNSMSPARVVRIGLDPFERIDGLVLPSEEAQMQSGVIDSSGEFAYLGSRAQPPRVVKLDLVAFQRVRGIELETDPGQLNTVQLDACDRYLHFGTGSEPGAVLRVDTSRPELRLEPRPVAFGNQQAGYTSRPWPVTVHNTGSSPAQELEIELVSPEFEIVNDDCPAVLATGEACMVDVVFTPAEVGESVGEMSVADAAGSWDAIELRGTGFADAGFRPDGSLDMPEEIGWLTSGLINPGGDSLYFNWQRPGFVGGAVEIATEPLKVLDGFEYPADEVGTGAVVSDSSGDYAYFVAGHRILKIELDTFTEVDSLTVTEGSEQLAAAVIDPQDEYAYFATRGSEARVFKVDLHQFVVDGILETELGEVFMPVGGMTPSGDYAFFAFQAMDNSAGVVRIDLNEFELAGQQELPDSWGLLSAMLVDPVGGYLYVAGGVIDIVRFDLATFEPAGSLPLFEEFDFITGGVIAPMRRVAFLIGHTEDYSAQLIKVDLEAFELVDQILLAPEIIGFPSLVMNVGSPLAYAGIDSSVVRVRLDAPRLQFHPQLLSFGGPDGASPPQNLTATLANEGDEELTGMVLYNHDSNFEITWTSCDETLPGGESCEVEVAFDDSVQGVQLGKIHVNTDQWVPARLDLVAGVIDPIFEDRFESD